MKQGIIYSSLLLAALSLNIQIASACSGKSASCPPPSATSCPSHAMHGSGHGYTGNTSAHHSEPGAKPYYLRALLQHADAIQLTDKQRQAIAELLVESETAVAEAHAKGEAVVAAFRSLHRAGKASERDAKHYATAMGKLRTARLQTNLTTMLKAEALLSEKQRQTLEDLWMSGATKGRP